MSGTLALGILATIQKFDDSCWFCFHGAVYVILPGYIGLTHLNAFVGQDTQPYIQLLWMTCVTFPLVATLTMDSVGENLAQALWLVSSYGTCHGQPYLQLCALIVNMGASFLHLNQWSSEKFMERQQVHVQQTLAKERHMVSLMIAGEAPLHTRARCHVHQLCQQPSKVISPPPSSW